ncbi:MAG: hypothetical protein M3P43_05370 [Actinomycetota bacterium]|nr:hypothetical protein [Actinomycetota bacterium]
MRTPDPLVGRERRIYSQNGEDGIIEALFSEIGTTDRSFVEIGADDGRENCTRQLAESGWSGVWIEADPRKSEASKRFAGSKVCVVATAVRRDNVVRSLHAAGVPPAPDLLVLDIDGNDWWVLDALLHEFHPRVVVVEYNATFQPGQWWVQRYRADRAWNGTFRHGASLDALTDLMRSSNLVLVACDSRGVNAFFVEAGAAATVEATALGDVGYHYVGPWFSSSLWGHPRVPSGNRAMFAMDREELDRVSIIQPRRVGSEGPVAPEEPVAVRVCVDNPTLATLRSADPAPVHLGLSWRERGDNDAEWREPRRALLPVPVPARRRRWLSAWLPAPSIPGHYRLTVTLVQENVGWLDPERPGGQATIDVDVITSAPTQPLDPTQLI